MDTIQLHAPIYRWTVNQIPYDQIAHERIVGEKAWFYVLAASSFVESMSDLYARNLLQQMDGDVEACRWLREHWEREELQHGLALRRYVEEVWPSFNWQASFDGFCTEYRPCCKPELLEPTRALEMVARCVVETGTSGFYDLLHHISPEPVLAKLTGHIRNDEVGHYKAFYRLFSRYRAIEHPSRRKIALVLWKRLREIDQEDAYLALKNVFVVCNPGRTFNSRNFQDLRNTAGYWARTDYPYEMTVKMLLKPLRMHGVINRIALPLLVRHARRVVAPVL